MRAILVPEIETAEDLRDLCARTSFYLAHTAVEQLVLITDQSLPAELVVPEALDPGIATRYRRFSNRIRRISPRDRAAIDRLLTETGLVLIWNLEKAGRQDWKAGLEGVPRKQVYRVDKRRERLEGSFYIEAGFRNESSAARLDERNRSAFESLRERLGFRERAYVFGAGPSVDQYRRFDFADGLTVICNSLVKDRDLMEHVRPEILCFGDPIFHFGCSRYAARFRDEVRRAAQHFDFDICIPRKYFSLFVDLLPDLESRTIGIPSRSRCRINLDLGERFELRSVDNVLTYLLLPLASTFAREVRVIGCDGRPLEEDQYFWSHSSRVQFVDLMDNIQMVHPGFFGLDYNEYYLRHCHNTELWLQAGEAIGRRYVSLVDSLVPALRRRGPARAAIETALEDTRDRFRVLSFNPDLVNDFGHYLHHDRRCRQVVERRGGGFASLANIVTTKQSDPRIVPWFESHSWEIGTDESARRFRHEVTLALELLKGADPETPTLVTMYLADHRHLLPLLAAIIEVRPSRVAFVLNLFYAHGIVCGDKNYQLQELKSHLRSTRQLRRELGVTLCADSAKLRAALSELCDESFRSWPMFSVTDYPQATELGRTARTPLVAYYPSNLQLAKGYDLLADMVERFCQDHDAETVRFVVRELYPSRSSRRMLPYADRLRKHAEMVGGVLSSEEYRRRMIDCDIVLVPYRRQAFESRTSAVVSDAIELAKPIVTTADTWPGEQVERFGNGATFPDGDVEGFHSAVDHVRRTYAQCAARAEVARDQWRREHSRVAFVDMVEELVAEVPEAPARQRGVTLKSELEDVQRHLEGRFRWYLNKLEPPRFARRAIESLDLPARWLIRRGRKLVERSPNLEARLRRYLWWLANRGWVQPLGNRLRRYLAERAGAPAGRHL